MYGGDSAKKSQRGSGPSLGRSGKSVANASPSKRSTGAQRGAGSTCGTAAASSGAPYSYSSAPVAVRSRGSITLPALDEDLLEQRADDGFGSEAEQSRDSASKAAAERSRIRQILNGDGPGWDHSSFAGGGEDTGPPPTEQDYSCEVAAPGIIVSCQSTGLCDVALRGVTRLPPSLHKFFRAEGGLVSELQLQGNRLTSAPPLELLPALTRLDLSSNMLSSVPASLGKLRRLQALDLSRNLQLLGLPDTLCDLTALTSLDLSHNGLECLPLRMGQLNRLVEMRLDSNELSYLPPACSGLPSLTALHLTYNRLTALPSELGGASSLTAIFAGHNKLTALPSTIGKLRQRLAELQLHNNELTVLPRELGLLAALTRLTTGCNPLVHPPLTVARRGAAAVREYLLGSWRADESAPVEGDDDCGVVEEDIEEDHAEAVPQELQPPPQQQQRRQRRRLVVGAACKPCVDKDDKIKELGQLLREARERLERAERQLEHSREQLGRQARDLAQQATRSVERDGEISRLNRQLAAASLLPGYRGDKAQPAAASPQGKAPAAASAGAAATAGLGPGAGDRSQVEVEAHLKTELRTARGEAEVAQAAADAAEREARRLRKEVEAGEQQVAFQRERAEELSAALDKERERCNAAVAAATEATHKHSELQPVVAERDELRKRLQTAKSANDEAWRAAQVARDGHLSSEAAADMVQGRLAATEAANGSLAQQIQDERRAAACAAVEADNRERQLQLELARLRADLATLMAERDVLHGVTPRQQVGDAAAMYSPAVSTHPAAGITMTSGSNAWAAPQRI